MRSGANCIRRSKLCDEYRVFPVACWAAERVSAAQSSREHSIGNQPGRQSFVRRDARNIGEKHSCCASAQCCRRCLSRAGDGAHDGRGHAFRRRGPFLSAKHNLAHPGVQPEPRRMGWNEPARHHSAGIYISCRRCSPLLHSQPPAKGRKLCAHAFSHNVAEPASCGAGNFSALDGWTDHTISPSKTR